MYIFYIIGVYETHTCKYKDKLNNLLSVLKLKKNFLNDEIHKPRSKRFNVQNTEMVDSGDPGLAEHLFNFVKINQY